MEGGRGGGGGICQLNVLVVLFPWLLAGHKTKEVLSIKSNLEFFFFFFCSVYPSTESQMFMKCSTVIQDKEKINYFNWRVPLLNTFFQLKELNTFFQLKEVNTFFQLKELNTLFQLKESLHQSLCWINYFNWRSSSVSPSVEYQLKEFLCQSLCWINYLNWRSPSVPPSVCPLT